MSPTAAPVTYGRDASIARFSVERYQKMIEAGILTAADQVELLENYVVLKMPRSPLRDGTIDLVKAALAALIPAGWLLRIQQTIALVDSQPEPDCAIVRGDPRSYLLRHPGSADAGLIIELADSSLLRDQRDKTRIYARAGIPCYWIINLVIDGSKCTPSRPGRLQSQLMEQPESISRATTFRSFSVGTPWQQSLEAICFREAAKGVGHVSGRTRAPASCGLRVGTARSGSTPAARGSGRGCPPAAGLGSGPDSPRSPRGRTGSAGLSTTGRARSRVHRGGHPVASSRVKASLLVPTVSVAM
jgi:Uma2 family endonuclease